MIPHYLHQLGHAPVGKHTAHLISTWHPATVPQIPCQVSSPPQGAHHILLTPSPSSSAPLAPVPDLLQAVTAEAHPHSGAEAVTQKLAAAHLRDA